MARAPQNWTPKNPKLYVYCYSGSWAAQNDGPIVAPRAFKASLLPQTGRQNYGPLVSPGGGVRGLDKRKPACDGGGWSALLHGAVIHRRGAVVVRRDVPTSDGSGCACSSTPVARALELKQNGVTNHERSHKKFGRPLDSSAVNNTRVLDYSLLMNGSLLIAFPRPTGAFPCFAFRSRIARRLPLAPAINHAKPE